ncbi:MAG: response regulator, partial [Candidatus Methanomethylophilaceae archaeon]
MKVLIVDDNVAVQEIIQDILLHEGYAKADVKCVSSVDEAVSRIGDFQPDIIMLDTWVGDEDGLRVVSRCRENLGEV